MPFHFITNKNIHFFLKELRKIISLDFKITIYKYKIWETYKFKQRQILNNQKIYNEINEIKEQIQLILKRDHTSTTLGSGYGLHETYNKFLLNKKIIIYDYLNSNIVKRELNTYKNNQRSLSKDFVQIKKYHLYKLTSNDYKNYKSMQKICVYVLILCKNFFYTMITITW